MAVFSPEKTQKFIKDATEKHHGRFQYHLVKITDRKTKVEIVCPIEGHGTFMQRPYDHIHGSGGCPSCSNANKGKSRLTQDEVINRFNNTHTKGRYDYSCVNFVNATTKVEIICPVEGHGKFLQSIHNHIGGAGCPTCGTAKAAKSSKTPKNDIPSIIAEFNQIHGGLYDYSKINRCFNSRTTLEIICPVEGHGSFFQSYNTHKKSGCPKCKGAKISASSTSTVEYALAEFEKTHGTKYDYSVMNFVNMNTHIEIICNVPEHPNFWQTPTKHRSGRKCPACSRIDAVNNNPHRGKGNGISVLKLTTEDFIRRSTEKHGGIYEYTEATVFTGIKNLVKIECKIHGMFEQRADKHMNVGHGCPICGLAKQTSKIGDSWISTLGVNVIPEHPLPNVRFRKVDGYDPTTNTVYQFHGDFYHGNPNHPKQPADKMNTLLKKTFGELYENTQRLDQEIRDAGYELVIMWEMDWRKISNQPKK